MRLTRITLKPHTADWVQRGLVSQEQEEAILDLYPASGRNYWMIAFAVIGSLLMLGGIILIIASHWESIPDLVKFISLLLLLGGVTILGAETRYRQWPRAWWECSYLAAAVFPLLGLALISQIFHLSGDEYELFLAWTLAVALLPFVSGAVSTWATLLVAAMITLGFWLDRTGNHTSFREGCLVYMIFGALCALGSQLWRRGGEAWFYVLGEFWGIMTGLLALYVYGFEGTFYSYRYNYQWCWVWLVLFLLCLGLIYRGYAAAKTHQVNLGFVMVALVVFSTFLRLVDDMLNTGMIFLIGGSVLIGGVVLLNRIRRLVLEKMS